MNLNSKLYHQNIWRHAQDYHKNYHLFPILYQIFRCSRTILQTQRKHHNEPKNLKYEKAIKHKLNIDLKEVELGHNSIQKGN